MQVLTTVSSETVVRRNKGMKNNGRGNQSTSKNNSAIRRIAIHTNIIRTKITIASAIRTAVVLI